MFSSLLSIEATIFCFLGKNVGKNEFRFVIKDFLLTWLNIEIEQSRVVCLHGIPAPLFVTIYNCLNVAYAQKLWYFFGMSSWSAFGESKWRSVFNFARKIGWEKNSTRWMPCLVSVEHLRSYGIKFQFITTELAPSDFFIFKLEKMVRRTLVHVEQGDHRSIDAYPTFWTASKVGETLRKVHLA